MKQIIKNWLFGKFYFKEIEQEIRHNTELVYNILEENEILKENIKSLNRRLSLFDNISELKKSISYNRDLCRQLRLDFKNSNIDQVKELGFKIDLISSSLHELSKRVNEK